MTPASKEALLHRIADAERSGKGGAALPFYATPAPELAAFATEYGIDPSFLVLLMTFAAGDTAFWTKAIEALPASVDSRDVTVRWIEWLWSDPDVGFRNRITDPALRAGGDMVCALHARAAAGETIARGDWRKARATLTAADDGDAVQAAAAEGIAAAAWDLEGSPGAAADMIYPWKSTLFAAIARELDWTAEKQAAADARFRDMVASAKACGEAAVEKARENGSMPEDAGQAVETTPLYQEAYTKGIVDFRSANPSDLDRYGDRTRGAVSDLYRLGREGLLRQITSLAAVPAA